MSNCRVAIGDRYGKLVVMEKATSNRWGQGMWLCVCDCGGTTTTMSAYLTRQETKSCGCDKYGGLGNKKHGQTRTPAWESWRAMQGRCMDTMNIGYSNYGGRGIRIHEAWLGPDGFSTFVRDMGPRPDGTTLDRIDVNGDYTPDNCRWADKVTQARNARTTRNIEHNGVTRCLSEWAAIIGINTATLIWRLRHWPQSRALTEAPNGR